MRIASIDVGTNTILLLISELDQNNNLVRIYEEQRIPRIGKSVDQLGNIGKDAFKRAGDIFEEYNSICSNYNVNKIIAAGTSALRDAKNSNEFIDHIKSLCEIEIKIISGETEANCTYLGAISGLSDHSKNNTETFTVIDIGGGSTEIVIGNHSKILNRKSINIGSVRLTERFLKHNPPTSEEILQFKEFINKELVNFNELGIESTSLLIGVAGTPTTLAAVDQDLANFQVERIANHILQKANIERIIESLKIKTTHEIENIPTIPKGRADVILAGSLILNEFMNQYFFTQILVSERGLRYGLALEQFKN